MRNSRLPAPLRRPTVAAALFACVLIASCTTRPPVETALQVIRTYGWQASVVDPAPDWSPTSTTIVARSLGGFSLFEEGGRGERRYAAEDRRETYYPRWVGIDSFVFGPGHNALRTTEGRVVAPSDGITLVTLGGSKPLRTQLANRGFQPKPGWEGRIWAQAEDRIITCDTRGHVEDFGDGFDPEPQTAGPGLCWRDRPAFAQDWWTGRSGPGTMYVRWNPGQVDPVAGAVQASWAHDGSVILTLVDKPAAIGRPWWSGGTHLVRLAGPGSQPASCRERAHDPAPHPLAELLAWVDDNGSVWMGTIRRDGWAERVAIAGDCPRWSPDGLRLLWTQPAAAAGDPPAIRVAVLGPKH